MSSPDWSRLQLWEGPSYRRSRRRSKLPLYITPQQLWPLWCGVILNFMFSLGIIALIVAAGIH